MSRFRYVILPRLLLVLSILALLAALFLLWLSMERPLPTIALACRQAGPPNCFTGGELLASGPIHMEETPSPGVCAWAVLRSEDRYALVTLNRTAGLLWTVYDFQYIDPTAELYPFSAANSIHLLYQEPAFSEFIPLAVCTNPSVVRLEGEALQLGEGEDPQVALSDRGVSIAWSPAGNGVWVGDAAITPLPNGGSMTYFWCRGYDADDNLVCSYDPTAQPFFDSIVSQFMVCSP